MSSRISGGRRLAAVLMVFSTVAGLTVAATLPSSADQTGTNNCAAPTIGDCPVGIAWGSDGNNYTSATDLTQSGTGVNYFECAAPVCKVSQNNNAGANKAVIDQNHSQSATIANPVTGPINQTLEQTATISQSNNTGTNEIDASQLITETASGNVNLPVTNNQEAHQTLTVSGHSDGAQTVAVTQHEKLTSTITGPRVIQKQNAVHDSTADQSRADQSIVLTMTGTGYKTVAPKSTCFAGDPGLYTQCETFNQTASGTQAQGVVQTQGDSVPNSQGGDVAAELLTDHDGEHPFQRPGDVTDYKKKIWLRSAPPTVGLATNDQNAYDDLKSLVGILGSPDKVKIKHIADYGTQGHRECNEEAQWHSHDPSSTIEQTCPGRSQAVTAQAGSAQNSSTDGVGNAQAEGLTASGNNFSANAGQDSTAQTASFTSQNANDNESSFSINIDWADGSAATDCPAPCPDLVDELPDGSFTVSGTHRYAVAGEYPDVTTTITKQLPSSSITAVAYSTATVTATEVFEASGKTLFNEGTAFSGAVASFTDTIPGEYTASINWGGESTEPGTVVNTGAGAYDVTGSHTFGSLGPKDLVITITKNNGQQRTANTKIYTYAYVPGGGAFVIGDGNAAVNSNVTWWANDWYLRNQVSGTLVVPSAFKGFENTYPKPNVRPVTCGTNWSTSGGNSPPPPNAIPSYMGTIVTSKVTKKGTTISGTTAKLVIVQTNPGYNPSPGTPGTGTVIVEIPCS